MSLFFEPDCIWDLKAGLGEGLVWMAAETALYSVDIAGRQIHRIVPDSGERQSWEAPARPTFLVPEAGGHLLCGCEDGLRSFDGRTGRFGALLPVETTLPENRLNDACVDPEGRLWFGTMHDPETEASGALYCLDPRRDEVPLQRDRGYVVSNGPAIDAQRGWLYHNDSARQRIYRFTRDVAGDLRDRQLFAQLTEGYPDGMAVDAEGFLWVALYAGGGVQRFAPDGRRDRFVGMPCDNVTKIVFGGADYRTAFVSTARKGIPEERLASQPLAGGLFRFRAEVPGLPPCVYRP